VRDVCGYHRLQTANETYLLIGLRIKVVNAQLLPAASASSDLAYPKSIGLRFEAQLVAREVEALQHSSVEFYDGRNLLIDGAFQSNFGFHRTCIRSSSTSSAPSSVRLDMITSNESPTALSAQNRCLASVSNDTSNPMMPSSLVM